MTQKYVVDTSIVIEKMVSKLIKNKEIKGTIIVPNAVVAELEAQANRGQEIGLLGLEELQELQKLKGKEIDIQFMGHRPNETQIKFAKAGEIDASIRDIAYQEKAILITADFVQAESAKAFGMEVKYYRLRIPVEKLKIESYFDEHTMSIHLKEDCHPLGKRGKPGDWKLEKINEEKLTRKHMIDMAKEIVEKSRVDYESMIEIDRRGSTIVQYKNYRIVIVRPPVAEGWEITVVRPIKKLHLKDYQMSEKIAERLYEKSRGIVVAGEPGSGKSTLVQALGEKFVELGKVTKTIESPRDLQMPPEVTQYSKNLSSSEEIHDILFLSRPDNIIFDEMRDTPDFQLYIDVRLGGCEMVGVVHAASPIDAVQRFITRMDVGMIPNVVDTIVYVKAGAIDKVLSLKMMVKVPTGMTEADLARPVIDVTDFETGQLEFEIYSYGEQTVVIPIEGTEKSTGIKKLAEESILREFKKFVSDVKVDVVSGNKVKVYVPEDEIAKVIGTKGKNIIETEERLGMSIEVLELKREKKRTKTDYEEDKNHITFYAEPGQDVEIWADGKFILSAITSKKGDVKIHKKSSLGRHIMDAINSGRNVEVKM